MIVLNKGKIKNAKQYFKCSTCNCEFIANEKEDKHIDQRDGDYVICPTCKAWIDWNLGKELDYSLVCQVYDEIKKIFDDDTIDWERKYSKIFESGLCNTFCHVTPNYFEWYDPDASYQDDVRAFVDAATEYVLNHKK